MKNVVSLLLVSVDNGMIKLLLEKDNNWVVPNTAIKDDFESSLKKIYFDKLGFNNINCKQVHTIYLNNTLVTNYIGLIDNNSIKRRSENLNVETKWFRIDQVPMVDKEIINDDIDYLKYLLMFEENVKLLYPETFTLPELKKVYDKLYGIDIDRRNFRKKLVNQNIVVETDEISKLEVGRPAKLYRLSNENHFINFREDL